VERSRVGHVGQSQSLGDDRARETTSDTASDARGSPFRVLISVFLPSRLQVE
jgi:hypothetical protein